jgi:hypothetical protein
MKLKKNGSFDRKKLMEKEIEHITFHVRMDCKEPPALLLDGKPKGRKKTIPLRILQSNTPLGPKSHTYWVTNWKSIQTMEIEIDVNGVIMGQIV